MELRGNKITLEKYKQNLYLIPKFDTTLIYSYDTLVGEFIHSKNKLFELGYWSVTTRKHINYVGHILEIPIVYYEDRIKNGSV